MQNRWISAVQIRETFNGVMDLGYEWTLELPRKLELRYF